MVEIKIPYGKTFLTGCVAEKNLSGIYHSALPPAAADEALAVSNALDSPIGSPQLETLAGNALSASPDCGVRIYRIGMILSLAAEAG